MARFAKRGVMPRLVGFWGQRQRDIAIIEYVLANSEPTIEDNPFGST